MCITQNTNARHKYSQNTETEHRMGRIHNIHKARERKESQNTLQGTHWTEHSQNWTKRNTLKIRTHSEHTSQTSLRRTHTHLKQKTLHKPHFTENTHTTPQTKDITQTLLHRTHKTPQTKHTSQTPFHKTPHKPNYTEHTQNTSNKTPHKPHYTEHTQNTD